MLASCQGGNLSDVNYISKDSSSLYVSTFTYTPEEVDQSCRTTYICPDIFPSIKFYPALKSVSFESKVRIIPDYPFRYTQTFSVTEPISASIGLFKRLTFNESKNLLTIAPSCFPGAATRLPKKEGGIEGFEYFTPSYCTAKDRAALESNHIAWVKPELKKTIMLNPRAKPNPVALTRGGTLSMVFVYLSDGHESQPNSAASRTQQQLELGNMDAGELSYRETGQFLSEYLKVTPKLNPSEDSMEFEILKGYGKIKTHIRIRLVYAGRKNPQRSYLEALIKDADVISLNGHADFGSGAIFEVMERNLQQQGPYKIIALNACFSSIYSETQEKRSYDLVVQPETILFSAYPHINLGLVKLLFEGGTYQDWLKSLDKHLRTTKAATFASHRSQDLKRLAQGYGDDPIPFTLVLPRTEN